MPSPATRHSPFVELASWPRHGPRGGPPRGDLFGACHRAASWRCPACALERYSWSFCITALDLSDTLLPKSMVDLSISLPRYFLPFFLEAWVSTPLSPTVTQHRTLSGYHSPGAVDSEQLPPRGELQRLLGGRGHC